MATKIFVMKRRSGIEYQVLDLQGGNFMSWTRGNPQTKDKIFDYLLDQQNRELGETGVVVKSSQTSLEELLEVFHLAITPATDKY